MSSNISGSALHQCLQRLTKVKGTRKSVKEAQEGHRPIQRHCCVPPLPPACKLQHSQLLFVIRAAEQRYRAAALTFSKVIPLNFSISTCLHAGYGACHVTRARFQGRAGGEAQQPSHRVSGWGEGSCLLEIGVLQRR